MYVYLNNLNNGLVPYKGTEIYYLLFFFFWSEDIFYFLFFNLLSN